MNDIRRTILWVIFGFSMVLLWDQWQVHNGNKPTFGFGQPKPTATAPAGAASGVPSRGLPRPPRRPRCPAPFRPVPAQRLPAARDSP